MEEERGGQTNWDQLMHHIFFGEYTTISSRTGKHYDNLVGEPFAGSDENIESLGEMGLSFGKDSIIKPLVEVLLQMPATLDDLRALFLDIVGDTSERRRKEIELREQLTALEERLQLLETQIQQEREEFRPDPSAEIKELKERMEALEEQNALLRETLLFMLDFFTNHFQGMGDLSEEILQEIRRRQTPDTDQE